MAGELAVAVPTEAPARRRGNFGPRDKKNRFAKRPRVVWVEGKRARGILEDMQMVYHQTSDKDSGVGQKWWRKLLRDDPVKFLETVWKVEKWQLGLDEAAEEQARELEKANEQVRKLKAKVTDLETSLREKSAELTARVLEEARDIRNYRAVKEVEKLIDDFLLKTEKERQQSVKIGQCILCGQKLRSKPSEAALVVVEPERRDTAVVPTPATVQQIDSSIPEPRQPKEPVAVPKPITLRQVDPRIPETLQFMDPWNLTDEDRPYWRALAAKMKRNELPLSYNLLDFELIQKYGHPSLYIKMKN
jgi:hypothetical protein